MLFPKMLSDEFDRKRHQLHHETFAHLKDQPDLVSELLEDKTSYGETFYVPKRARWHESWKDENGETVPALKDLKHDIGNMLNKAIAAIEDENDSLAGGVLSRGGKEKIREARTSLKEKTTELEMKSVIKLHNSNFTPLSLGYLGDFKDE